MDLQGGAHLVRECPTEAIRHDVVLPRLIREDPAGLHPKRKGVMGLPPLALRVVVYRVNSSVAARSVRATMLNWTSFRAFE